MNLTQHELNSAVRVKELLLERGATVASIASASFFDEAPAGHTVEDVLPGAKSVVVTGIKLVSAVANWPQRVWADSEEVKRDCWRIYDHCAFYAPNMRLVQLEMELAVAFELAGEQAIFFSGRDDMSTTEINANRFYQDLDMPQPLDEQKITALQPDLESPTRYAAPLSYRHPVAAGPCRSALSLSSSSWA